VRIAWEIHLGRLQQQQQQKQHASGLDKDESRPTTSSGSDSRYCDRTNENGRCKGQGDAMLLQPLVLHTSVIFYI